MSTLLRSERFYYDGIRRIQEVILDPMLSTDGAQQSGDPGLMALAAATTPEPNPDTTTALLAFEQAVLDDDNDPIDPQPWLAREYVCGPGDGPGGVDELLVQFAPSAQDARSPWWVLQDAGGDVMALCDLGGRGGSGDAWRAFAPSTAHSGPCWWRCDALASASLAQVHVGIADMDLRYRDGTNLYEYLASNSATHFDPLGLWIGGMAIGIFVPSPGDLVRGALQGLITEYANRLEQDMYWALDWDAAEDWHSRLESEWVYLAMLQGVFDRLRGGWLQCTLAVPELRRLYCRYAAQGHSRWRWAPRDTHLGGSPLFLAGEDAQTKIQEGGVDKC